MYEQCVQVICTYYTSVVCVFVLQLFDLLSYCQALYKPFEIDSSPQAKRLRRTQSKPRTSNETHCCYLFQGDFHLMIHIYRANLSQFIRRRREYKSNCPSINTT